MVTGKKLPKKIPAVAPQKGAVPPPPSIAKPKSNLLYYLIVLCCFGNFLPYLITTSVNCANARGFIRQEAFDHLVSVRDIKRNEVENFLNERRADALYLSRDPLFMWAIASFLEAFKKGGLEGKDYIEVDSRYGKMLTLFADTFGYYEVLVIDTAGNVFWTAKKHPELGRNILAPPYSDTPIAEAFKRGKATLTLGDIKWYEPYKGPAQFLSAPVKKEGAEEPFAVLVLHMEDTQINNMMTQRPGLKESGETYLVGQDQLLRSDSRFTPETDVLKRKVDTQASREALAGKTDAKIIKDYRNVSVLSAYAPVEVASGIRWALIAEIDKAEAMALEDKMVNQVVYMTFAMFPIWGGIIFVFYRLIKKDNEAFYGRG